MLDKDETLRTYPRSWVWRASAWATVALVVFCAIAAAAPASAQAAETFWARDWSTSAYSQIQASARYVGEHCVVYVHDQALFHDVLVTQLAAAFDTAVYPILEEAYGSEPDPGIDGDPRIAILVYDFRDDTIDGSFNNRDIDPGNSTRSNHREMFYLNLQSLISDPQNMGALAAHEFAHLILYYRDAMLDPSPSRSAESTWLTEGFTTYAEHLAGYDARVNGQLLSFTLDPSLSLTNWLGWRANYGASYAFVRYLAQRQGADFVRALVGQPLDGTAGISATLNATGAFESFDTLYDDWILANFLDGHAPQWPPFAYSDLTVAAAPQTLTGDSPLLGSGETTDFGAVYLDFPASSRETPFQAVIDGADKAPLLAALISWDSEGLLSPLVTRFALDNVATGGTVTAAPGFDRHTLAVWARGTVGSTASYAFRYSGATDPPAGVQFMDMGGSDPFYAHVAKLLTLGVVSGKEVPAGSGLWFFAGKENVLRKQFAKMIMEAVGLHTPVVDRLSDPSFRDVRPLFDKDGWPLEYPYDYIEEAAALGIVTGYAGDVFKPDSPITRSQLVLMITRGATAAGQPLPVYDGSEKKFADVPPSHPRYRDIMTAYAAGILSGSQAADGRWYFYPDSPASRSHVAKMTAKLCEHLGR